MASVATGVLYLAWRLSTIAGPYGVAFWLAELAGLLLLVLGGALLWPAPRDRRPPRGPRGSLAVFVAVCGEPAEMVERTLRAAMAIGYPHETYVLNDGRLAGKANWREIESLAARLGLPCFTRIDGAKGKAGNLNHALRRTTAEFIATIDADHCAISGFAHHTLGYFEDERVAFVATPQQFDEASDSVLNSRELFFYRALQPAKDRANSAFSCGNASVYRRAALEQIGGFSEWNIVEDLHTSYELHARGWRSVYHPQGLTVGTAPETAAALAKQRLTWATDGLRLLLWDSPLRKRRLSLIQRLHYMHGSLFYLLMPSQLLFALGPLLYLTTGVGPMHFDSVAEYAATSVPYYLAVIGFLTAYGGGAGWFRPVSQQVFLAPVYLLALVRALSGRRFEMGVTEKASAQSRASRLLLPAALATALSAGVVVRAIAEWDPALVVAGLWALWFLLAMAGPLSAMSRRPAARRRARMAVHCVVAVALVLVVAPEAARHELPHAASPASAAPRHDRAALHPPEAGAYVGVFDPSALASTASQPEWQEPGGAPPAIRAAYQRWTGPEARFPASWASSVDEAGGVPMLTWEPWNGAGGTGSRRMPASIAKGRHDAYLRAWARAAAAYGRPLLLRFMPSPNGDWYPWSDASGGADGGYVRAWRHARGIFRRAGASNVAWVWSISTFDIGDRDIASLYPGDDHVDWVGASGLNWGRATDWGRWRDVDGIFRSAYEALVELDKPVMITEIGTTARGGDAARWIERSLDRLRSDYPRVRAVVWYGDRYSARADFRLRGMQAAAFRRATAARFWRPRLRLGPEPPDGALHPERVPALLPLPALTPPALAMREAPPGRRGT